MKELKIQYILRFELVEDRLLFIYIVSYNKIQRVIINLKTITLPTG